MLTGLTTMHCYSSCESVSRNSKSSVENAVGILEKGFFHKLEERQYFSLEQFNKDLWKELEALNKEPFKKKEHNRYYYWEEEQTELMPLPPCIMSTWRERRQRYQATSTYALTMLIIA